MAAVKCMVFITWIPAITATVFTPRSRGELATALDACIANSQIGNCTQGPAGPIGLWDVSRVNDMSFLFNNTESFNSDVSKWDMSSVTDISYMFSGAISFNGDLSQWDVSGVTDMTGIFYNPAVETTYAYDSSYYSYYLDIVKSKFNGDLSKWNVSSVTTLSKAFYGAASFNGDLSKWGVSKVTRMDNMFSDATSFNCDLSKWHVSNVTRMDDMFFDAKSFNGDLSKWDVSRVTNMRFMFSGAISFNGDLSKWDVSSVTTMSNMFSGAQAFSQDLSKWNVSSVDSMFAMFSGATSFNGDVSKLDVSIVTRMDDMFAHAFSFNGNISMWNVSSVVRMDCMFSSATAFNGDLSKWNVSSVTRMDEMFAEVASFNGDLSNWDVSSVINMRSMFSGATTFNGDISEWDVSRVTRMDEMFSRARSFGSDISKWDVSGVKRMDKMFYNATSFNSDLSRWNVSSVSHMWEMFAYARSFNGDISAWDVARVTRMNYMFSHAISFNGDISAWNVSRVTTTREMFRGAHLFNANLSSWDVFSVYNMRMMFLDAKSFSQTLCGAAWANSKANKDGMFKGSSGSISRSCTLTSTSNKDSIKSRCDKCGRTKSGKLSCCARGGAWFQNCGDTGDPRFEHTWFEGAQACKVTKGLPSISRAKTACPKCGTNKSGKLSCCARGGAWFQKCGDPGDSKFEHTWFEGTQACGATAAPPMTTPISLVCPKCGTMKNSGVRSCCARDGSWFQKCGNANDGNFQHTWSEGTQVCKAISSQGSKSTAASPVTAKTRPVCPKCGTLKNSGARSCCARDGSWFQNCGNGDDDNFDHTWFEGTQACKSLSSQRIKSTAAPLPVTPKTIPACPKCGTIYTWYPIRSGTPSCCARDGSWFKNCGNGKGDDFDYTWFEGIQACEIVKTSTAQPGMLREKIVIDNQAYASEQNQTNTVSDNDDVPGASSVNSNVLFGLTATVAGTSLLLIA